MSRRSVRDFKRAVSVAARGGATETDRHLSREGALALLARSIRFGHGRLTLLRLAKAVEMGAAVNAEQWLHCAQIAQETGDAKLRTVYLSALDRARPAPWPRSSRRIVMPVHGGAGLSAGRDHP